MKAHPFLAYNNCMTTPSIIYISDKDRFANDDTWIFHENNNKRLPKIYIDCTPAMQNRYGVLQNKK